MTTPIPHSYWVTPQLFLAAEYPRTADDASSIEKIQHLESAGIRSFIDLTEEDEHLEPYAQLLTQATHQRFPIPDVSVPTSREATIATLDAIDASIANGQCVYLHCWGGRGRTGTIVGCWLVRHGRNGEEALAHLQQLWSHNPKSANGPSPESTEQREYILNWQES